MNGYTRGVNSKFLPRVFLLALLLVSCTRAAPVALPVQPLPLPTMTAFQPQTAAPGSAPAGLWLDPATPQMLRLQAEKNSAPLGQLAVAPEAAGVRLELLSTQPAPGDATWIYALAAAFPTARDGVNFDELQAAWNGDGGGLLMSADTLQAMKPVFGGQAGAGVRVMRAQELSDGLWRERSAWAIVPFESLEPRLKVLEIDGRSPLRKEFDLAAYPLVAHFRLEPGVYALPASNRDPQKLVTVLVTGTTALVRAISFKMQVNGIDYPARDIGDWLRGADILHISNEVAFSPNCPPPDPNDGSLRFCSAPANIGLLEDIGVDVIELSGNHVNDWGRQALAGTLEMYGQRGWPVFAGGADALSARQPAILERGGGRFAFVGCNTSGPDFAWATASLPGAADCGDYGWLADEIRKLKADGFMVIATLQHYEYYSPEARPGQSEDFRRLAEAGADVVSGSQAHYSQMMEFHAGAFIHYGPGNLFFDQMGFDYADGTRTTDTRREFLDRYVFYDGRLAGIELLTAMLEDYSRPRPMTPAEREQFLQEYFSASGW